MTSKVEGLLSRHIDVVVFFEPKENPDVTEQMWGVLDHIAASEIIWVIPTYLQSPTASLLRDDLLITINIYRTKHVCVPNSFLYSDKSWQDAWNEQPSRMPGPSSLTLAVLWRPDKYFHQGHTPELRSSPPCAITQKSLAPNAHVSGSFPELHDGPITCAAPDVVMHKQGEDLGEFMTWPLICCLPRLLHWCCSSCII